MDNRRQILKMLLGISTLTLSSGLASNVNAAYISSLERVFAPNGGSATAVPLTTAEGNNNVNPPTNSNTLDINVTFDSPGPIDLEFQVISNQSPSDWDTEYSVRTLVRTNSEVGFGELKLTLGYRLTSNRNDDLTDFFTSPEQDGLDFDQEDFGTWPPTSDTFSTQLSNFEPDEITYSGGVIPADGLFYAQAFRLDIPFINANIPQFRPPLTSFPLGYQFVLRLEPTPVPVPAAFPLLASALVAIGFIARRRAAH